MPKTNWEPPAILIKILEAQRLVKMAEKIEIERKLESANRLLQQQLDMLETIKNGK